MPDPVPSLTLAHGQDWARRVPTTVLTIVPLAVVILFVASFASEPGGLTADVDEVTSWTTLATYVLVGVGTALLLLGWYAPRAAVLPAAAVMLPALFVSNPLDEAPWWLFLVAYGWLLLVVMDICLLLRQRGRAPGSPPVATPGPPRSTTDHHRGIRLVSCVVLACGVVAALTIWFDWRSDLRAFAARAVPVVGEVTEVDSGWGSIQVEVEGEELEFFVNDTAAHPVGSAYLVHTDPEGEESPYGADDADPGGMSLIGIPIGASLAGAWIVVFSMGRRRRRVEALGAGIGGGLEARVEWHPTDDGFTVFAIDDVEGRHPLFLLPKVESLVEYSQPERSGVRGGIDDLREMARLVTGGAREWPPDDDTYDDLDDLDDDSGPLRHAVVTGLAGDGSLCAVHLIENGERHTVVSLRPARDPRTLRLLRARVLDRLAAMAWGREEPNG